ncbi:cell division transport system permease protein [Rhodoblastus acidophilus]|uniref:Cell division transport system permease protein n=1 Tax=Rhodoblastus acidophilus TaxID=1074 RepID=A0A212R332_RHOAC|nr:ABC transporter permease [Rhodoblastus acidophilus]PPQ40303.1 ABC transporter permease [Rhodoblastus acidophilus]RAI17400.1 ABC transporter permease [Rhodoblastus acidophilus]SNB66248.1 cell division transport system permease protein [Rhodoblastus acidophilus]
MLGFPARRPEADDDSQQSWRENWAETPLVPAASVAGAALSVVIAIMTFLAALTASFALLLTQASHDWRGQVGAEMTIQVMPRPGRDLDADSRKAVEIVASFPGLRDARALSKGQSEELLAPWLGAGLDLGQLPVPRLIEVRRDGSKPLDEIGLRSALAAALPNANLDNHGAWMQRLTTMADVVVASALGVFALVLTAMGLAVGFATRGAMAGAREIIQSLHYVGAADSFIANEFQRHFLRLGLRGGAIGGGAAALLFFALGALSRQWTTSAGGEQAEAMFGAFALGWDGLAAIVALSLGVAGLTGLASRVIVHRSLRALN